MPDPPNATQQPAPTCFDVVSVYTALEDHLNHDELAIVPLSDPGSLQAKGDALRRRFEQTKSLSDIDDAIEAYDQAVTLTSPEDLAYPSRVCAAATAFILPFDVPELVAHRAERLKTYKSSILARIALLQALANSVDDNSRAQLATIHECLANLHYALFELSADIQDLCLSIASFERAVGLYRPRGGPEHRKGVRLLSWLLLLRIQLVGDPSDFSTSIKYQEELLHAMAESEAELLAETMDQVSIAYLRRAVSIGCVDDITRAIDYQQKSMSLTPKDHSNYANRLSELGSLFETRADRTRSLEDINDAIAYGEKSVALTVNDADRLHRMCTLASSFAARGEITRSVEDVSSAIELQRQAVRSAAPNHPLYAMMLTSLGTSFMIRYRRTRATADLSYAIAAYEDALKAQPHDKAHALERIADHLILRAEDLKLYSLEDINNAISYIRQSISLTPTNHPRLGKRWESLACALTIRFSITKDTDDINNAIDDGALALSLTPDQDHQRSVRLYRLSLSLFARFDWSQEGIRRKQEDLDRAIPLAREALKLAASQTAEIRARIRFNLALLLVRHYETQTPQGSVNDLGEALGHLSEVVTDPDFDFHRRIEAAIIWAKYAGDHAEVLRACSIAIALYHEYYTRLETTTEESHNALESEMAGAVGRMTARFALRYGEKELAVQWLEQGSCLVWTRLAHLRPLPENLKATHPDLANRFEEIGRELKELVSRGRVAQWSSIKQVIQRDEVLLELRRHTEISQEWRRVLYAVREVQGFSSFLKPLTMQEYFEGLPKDGSVVLVTATHLSSDALVLRAGHGVMHIPLPDLNYVNLVQMVDTLQAWLRNNGARGRKGKRGLRFEKEDEVEEGGLQNCLADLWLLVVKPVFDALEYQPHPNQAARPRIWWSPAGKIAFLPLHAAGIYGVDGCAFGDSAMDYIVSSYTPTVAMLLGKLSSLAPPRNPPARLLLVSQPKTPGLPPIPGAEAEVSSLAATMKLQNIPTDVLAHDEATIDQVQAKMVTSSWAHFACHAIQDPVKPLKSGMHLYDGRLELSQLMEGGSLTAEFAFLSACQTGTGHEALAQEAVHIAAGMLAAGYRGVVGSIWALRDVTGPVVAREFYKYLLEGSKDGARGEEDESKDQDGLTRKKLDVTKAAGALHFATQVLRAEVGDGEDGLMTWIPYVHFGV